MRYLRDLVYVDQSDTRLVRRLLRFEPLESASFPLWLDASAPDIFYQARVVRALRSVFPRLPHCCRL